MCIIEITALGKHRYIYIYIRYFLLHEFHLYKYLSCESNHAGNLILNKNIEEEEKKLDEKVRKP
jgi:hypothetical protein